MRLMAEWLSVPLPHPPTQGTDIPFCLVLSCPPSSLQIFGPMHERDLTVALLALQVYFIYLFVCLFIHSFIYLFVYLFVYLFIHLFIYLLTGVFWELRREKITKRREARKANRKSKNLVHSKLCSSECVDSCLGVFALPGCGPLLVWFFVRSRNNLLFSKYEQCWRAATNGSILIRCEGAGVCTRSRHQ